MATEYQIQLRNDTRANWASNDPTPAAGEVCVDTTNSDVKPADGSASYTNLQSIVPAGCMFPFAGPSGNIPSGYFECDGSAVSRTGYPELYAAIGTAWGAGDGSTTFNLPDTSGAVLRNIGNGTINGRTKTGPASVGDFQEDAIEQHSHLVDIRKNATAFSDDRGDLPWTNTGGNNYDNQDQQNPIKSVHSARTTPDETIVYSAGVIYIIKAY